MLLYVDNALCISHQAEHTIRNDLGKYFELKEPSIGPPKIYLSGHCCKVTLETGVEAPGFRSSQYVRSVVKNVEDYLSTQSKYSMYKKAKTPLPSSYRPELDISPKLGLIKASYFMSLTGILRWIVELGRVDVCLEVSMMSSHMAMPREGHLSEALHIFSYLRKYHNAEMVFYPSDPDINESKYERKDWTSSEFGHIGGKEELPKNMPEPRGLGFVLRTKVDADHASDTTT